jgi:hypothetical protein
MGMAQPISPALTLAGRLAGLFSALPQVEAVALSGSQAGGAADAGSDIDLYVYTRAGIPLADRQALLDQSGGASRADLGLTFWGDGDEWIDAASGIEVDIVYFDAGWMQAQLAGVIDAHQPALGYTTCFWHTVRQSSPFYDPRGWFAQLQEKARAPYPEALRHSIIAFNHPVLRGVIPAYLHQIEKAVQRGDRVSVNHRLAALLASYFDILFAANRVLHPGEKRLLALAAAMCASLPAGMVSDVEAVLHSSAAGDALLPGRLNRLLDRLDDWLALAGLLPGGETA